MAQPLLPSHGVHDDGAVPRPPNPAATEAMADLKVFWGPEICRLEYLVHLLETGRVKDEHPPQSA